MEHTPLLFKDYKALIESLSLDTPNGVVRLEVLDTAKFPGEFETSYKYQCYLEDKSGNRFYVPVEAPFKVRDYSPDTCVGDNLYQLDKEELMDMLREGAKHTASFKVEDSKIK